MEVDEFFTTPAMADVFSPAARVARMLEFEAALARAEAGAGVIPAEAAAAIASVCRVELIDVAALYRDAALAGTPAIPLVRMLTALVDANARDYVHWGATSQDAIDTALALQLRAGLDLLLDDLLAIAAECAALAERHRHTLMAGRTLLQQALPITFGLKAARWLALVTRQVAEQRARRSTLAVQLGGAAGTLAALGDRGLDVAERLAADLGLAAPDLPWHAERDRIAAVAAALGVLAGALAKIAGDLALLAQSEVAEVSESAAPGKGGSSAMPQKRNPVDSTAALACARLALGVVPVILAAQAGEHERAAGGWQAEWAGLPDLFRYSAGAAAHVRGALHGLQVDAARMRANLGAGGGLIMAEALAMALAPALGRAAAQKLAGELCARAVASGGSLHDAALADEQVRAALDPAALDRALEPAAYLGSADALIDRALAGYRTIRDATTR